MNTNCENKFYDITIYDLFPLVLKKWRKILLIGLIVAVVFGLYKFIPLLNIANNDQLLATQVIEKELLQDSINEIQEEVNLKEKELKESIYYNLEPSMITKGIVSYYIDAPIQDEALGFQSDLVYLYVDYFNSGEIYKVVAKQLSDDIKPVYLSQIIKAEANGTNAPSSFNIFVMGASSKQTNEILQLIKQEINNKQSEFSNLVSEHTSKLTSENIVVVSDSKVLDDQNFQTNRYEALKTELNDKKSQLQNIEAQVNTIKDAVISGLLYSLIGLLAGIVLAMIYYFITVNLSNNIKSRKQIIINYGLEVLGELIQKNNKSNRLDMLISKLAREPYGLSTEEINRIIANNIIAMSKSKNILIVGCKDIINTEIIFEGISSCDILMDYKVGFSDKPLHTSETLSNVLKCDSIILIVKKNKTSLDELQNAIHTVNKYNKDLVGTILV